MAINIKPYLTRRNIILGVLGVLALSLVIFGGTVITGDVAAASRKRYANQKAGITEASPQTSPVDIVAAATPTPTPVTDTNALLPDAKASGAQEDDTMAAPKTPGLIETAEATKPPVELPKLTAIAPPPVPTALLNQQLPGSQHSGSGPGNLARVEVAPSRYLFNNLSAAAVSGKGLVMADKDPLANIGARTFAPQGESILLATVASASTRDSEIPVIAGVWEPFYFNGNKILDVGDRLIGVAAAGKIQGRATVKFQKIIFKDGRSLAINAIATDPEGNMGIPGVKIGDVMLNSIGPVLLDLAGAVIQSFEQSASQVTGSGGITGGITSAAASLTGTQKITQDATQSAKNAGLQGGSAALNKISELMATDLEENKPYLLVLPGTPCRALLMTAIDISMARRGQ